MNKVGYIYNEERELNTIDFEEAYQLLKEQVKKDNHILGCDCSKKDKEIERLKAREQECIDKYLAESKYRSEIEGKYVLTKYVIEELEKWLEQEYAVAKANSIEEPDNPEWYIKWNERKNILDKLKALKEGKNE